MKIDELHKLRPGETSSSALARWFHEQGVSRDKICGNDLESFYQQLQAIDDSALNLTGTGIECQPSDNVSDDPVWAVIVETRKHPDLEFVVSQFVSQLNLNVQIFHGKSNKRFIKDSAIGALIKHDQVHLSNLATDDFSLQDYNALLLNPGFWKSLHGRRKILVFQTDARLSEKSSYSLDDFLSFDYVGTKWKRRRPVGIVADGGNGGLSLRDWGQTMACLERFPPSLWPGGEDGYYALHLDLMGTNVASDEDCSKFSTRTKYFARSFGTHQPMGLLQSIRARILDKFLG